MPDSPAFAQNIKTDALIVGGGPAGLAAAEVLAAAGLQVIVAEAMPSVGRKFLMAGKSGLNLTKDEPRVDFLARVASNIPAVQEALERFGPNEIGAWATELGEELFTGSTGRVFPKAMKASPLLRKWLAMLDEHSVDVRTRCRWIGFDSEGYTFDSPEGRLAVIAKVCVIALGGASWQRLGSNGAWAPIFDAEGIARAPFKPSNVGFAVGWSDHMATHFGAPVKNTSLSCGALRSRGEWVISHRGMEGGGVYEVSAEAREGTPLYVDLAPDLSVADVAKRLNRDGKKQSFSNRLRKALRLDSVKRALVSEFGRPLPADPDRLAELMKSLPIRHAGPLPLDGAISTAGGVSPDALVGLMLKKRPGVFVAGEMLDWDAPTGGYLLTASIATGRAAAVQALAHMAKATG